MRYKWAILFSLGISASALGQPGRKLTEEELFRNSSSAPPEMGKLFTHSGVSKQFNLYVGYLNPYYLSGDFDGDGKQDFLIQLSAKKKSSDWRIGVLFGNETFCFLERDDQLDYPGPSAWYVVPKMTKIPQGRLDGNGIKPPKTLLGDAIEMIQIEASSALVYWNGKRFVSYWQGD